MRYHAVINPEASSFKSVDEHWFADTLTKRFKQNGHAIEVRFHEGKNLAPALKAASGRPDLDAVIAGGGDGTISLAASLLHDTDKALAVLPGGNMNLFARSLGIPLDLEAAIDALAKGNPQRADMGFANDRPFIHEFSLGLHPEMIELRDRQRFGSRIGKIVGSTRSLWQVLMRPPRVRVGLDDGNGGERRIATAALAISNNPFGEGHLPYADRVDGGVLGVYVAHTFRPVELASMAARLQTGDWEGMPQMEQFTATQLRLTRRASIKAAIDGELVKMRSPVDIRIAPGALAVIVPREEDAVRGQ